MGSFCLCCKKLKNDICFEIKQTCEVVCKEFKAFCVIVLFIFFTMFFSMVNFDNYNITFKYQSIIVQSFDTIFNRNMLYSMITTGVLSIIMKKVFTKKTIKEQQKYWFISQTFVDRVGAIFLGAAGVATAAVLHIQIFYNYLDNGEFQSNMTRWYLIKEILAFIVLCFNIIIPFKYWSKRLVAIRENNYFPLLWGAIILAILIFLSKILPSILHIKII